MLACWLLSGGTPRHTRAGPILAVKHDTRMSEKTARGEVAQHNNLSLSITIHIYIYIHRYIYLSLSLYIYIYYIARRGVSSRDLHPCVLPGWHERGYDNLLLLLLLFGCFILLSRSICLRCFCCLNGGTITLRVRLVTRAAARPRAPREGPRRGPETPGPTSPTGAPNVICNILS